MQVKTDQVFLAQSMDDNSLVKQTVIVSNNAITARACFNKNFSAGSFLGITSLSDYISVHKKIMASLNGDENAWPVIVDHKKSDKN